MIKKLCTPEHLCFLTVCIVSIFSYSKEMTDVYILPKWCFTSLVLLLGTIILLMKQLCGKSLNWNILVCSYIIVGICSLQSLYGIAQWFQLSSENNFKVVGSFDNPAGYAACLCSAFPFAFLCLKSMKEKKQRIVIVFIISIFILALFMSASRSGIIGVIFIIIIALYKKVHIERKSKIILLVTTFSFFLTASYFLKKDSANGRLLIWECSWKMIKESPFVGHGIGSFRRCYMNYQSDYFNLHPNSELAIFADNVQCPFNEYLSIVLNFGFLGLVVLLAIILVLLYCYCKNPEYEKKIAMLSILGISVFSFFSYPFTYPFVWVIVFFCIYIITKDTFRLRIPCFCKNLLHCIILIMCIFSIWSLHQRIEAEYKWREATLLHNISYYEKLIPVLGKEPYFLYNYAVTLYEMKHLEESKKIALQCKQQWADYDLELLLGDIYMRKNEYALAEACYNKATFMCPCRFIPLYQLHRLYKKLGQQDKAYFIAQTINAKSVKVPSVAVKQIKNEIKQYMRLHDN